MRVTEFAKESEENFDIEAIFSASNGLYVSWPSLALDTGIFSMNFYLGTMLGSHEEDPMRPVRVFPGRSTLLYRRTKCGLMKAS